MNLRLGDDQERGPVWEHPEWLENAATRDKLISSQNTALKTEFGDPRVRVNFHDFRLGPQKLLRNHGRHVFEQVRSEFDLGTYDYWDCHRKWLTAMFRAVFPKDEEWIGTFAVLSARRPAMFREQQVADVRVTQDVAIPHFMGKFADQKEPFIKLGDIRVPTKGLRLAYDSITGRRTAELATIRVPRRVQASSFGIDERYDEFWMCLANRGEENYLREGKIPAVATNAYQPGHVRVRTCPLLTLVRLTRSMSYCFLVVEVHPESGEILSIRWCRMPFSVAMLNASPVEHDAVRAALQAQADG